MIVIPPVLELGSVMVSDAGVPNKERIVFRPTDAINLATCGILLAVQNEANGFVPIKNSFFWFGEVEVKPPCWILVFTGKGEPMQIQDERTGNPVHIFYWGYESTLFQYREQVPIVFRFAGVTFGGHLKILPSFKEAALTFQPPVTKPG
jgi:hypothetical protein